MLVSALFSTFAVLALFVHAIGFLILLLRVARSNGQRSPHFAEVVTLVRTIRDVGPFEGQTLRSTFGMSHPRTEVIFCAASADDPAVPLVRRLIEAHPHVRARLLIGDDVVTTNGKLNNMVKGWREASSAWVVFADSNLLLPPDCVARVLSAWTADAGAVCAPPIGSEPEGLCAEVECAFLNGYQARWQYAADAVGFGFAQGKTMLLRRGIIERAGGITSLGCEPAEDAALTKIVRAQGLSVRLADPVFAQPLGHRTLRQMIDRQTRWAQLRRTTFPALYGLEIFSGLAAPLAASALAAPFFGCSAMMMAASLVAIWLAVEAAFTCVAGWHFGWKSLMAWLLREILLPIVWLRGLFHTSYEWGGQTVTLDRQLPSSAVRASR